MTAQNFTNLKDATPTEEIYATFDRAYSFFNETLFGGTLPDCMITMQREKRAYGYFWHRSWISVETGKLVSEIAVNPNHFSVRTDKQTMSTLVHEMCHLQQSVFGKPSRNGYHNKEWAQMMKDVGLLPTDTGEKGGKETGQKVTHMIEKGGRYDKAYDRLMAKGLAIPYAARNPDTEAEARGENVDGEEGESRKAVAKKKRASKTKYSCPSCDLNAWAKPDVKIVCGECNEVLEAEELDDEE